MENKEIATTTNGNQNLMEMVSEYQWITQQLMMSGGELTPELDQWFTEIGKNLGKKGANYKFIMDRFETDEKFWKEQAEEATKAARVSKNMRDRLKDTFKRAMEMMDMKEIQSDTVNFKLVNAAPTVEIVDLEKARSNKEYWREETSVTLVMERGKMIQDLKEGREIPGVVLVPVNSLRISLKRGVLS